MSEKKEKAVEGVTFKEIWETLSNVNVNEDKEQKRGLTYLSWAWACHTLMKYYPQAKYEFTMFNCGEHSNEKDVCYYSDGTCMVECTMDIDGNQRVMWLPVMDYRNNAIPKPPARAISDTKMRCLVKCISMFGLGAYIYAGEDLPKGEQ